MISEVTITLTRQEADALMALLLRAPATAELSAERIEKLLLRILKTLTLGQTKTSEEKSSLVSGVTERSVFEGFVAKLQVVVDILHVVVVLKCIQKLEDFLLLGHIQLGHRGGDLLDLCRGRGDLGSV